MDPNQDVLPYDGHKTNPDILVSNCSASDPVVSVCNGGDDQLHQGKRKRKKNGSTSIPFSSVGTSACSDGDEQLQKRGRQSHQVTFALSDVFIMSDDGCWKEGLLNYLKKKRPHLRFTSKEDWICGKSKIDNLIISTERSKLVVIGFTVNPETDYSSYAAHSVVEGMLEAKTLDDKRLIVVKLAENAEIPSAFLPLTVANASEDNFLPALLKIVDECDVKNTLFEGNVKAIIGRGLTRHNMKEELVAEFAKDWSLNFEEDCDSTVVSNENEIDICIVSADNEWETEVCKMLRKERSGRSKLNVISIHEFFSTFGHPRNIISDAVTIEKFVKCVYTSKKVVIGFGTKDNGYPNLIAGIVFNKIGSENKHFEQLIPVKLSTDAILAETVKYLEPLDGSLHGDVVENILKTLDLHHVRLKVSCQNRNSENFATIEDKLNEYVEDFEDHCNPLLKRIKKYFSEKGLTLNGITIGCILLHLSAPDAKTLQCLSDIDMRREFMEELAKFLLPQSLHVEFTQEWSMNIYNEENVHGPGIFPSLNVVHSNKAKVSEKGSNFTNTITSANDIAALLKVQPKLEPNTGSSFRSCANDSDIISSRGSTLTDFVQYVCDQESVNQHGMTGNANTKKAGFILATPAMARPVAITRSTGQTGALSITNPIIGSTPDQQQVSRDEYTSSFAGEVENLSRGGTRRLNTNDMSRIWDYGGQPIYHSIHHLFGGTALRNACENGHVECAKLLIDAGADVHVKADFGGTALRNACENGHVECAKLLIDAGADVHVKADFGGTALRNACENGHVECAKLLIDAGADVHVKADDGFTLLHSCFLRPEGTYAKHLSVSIALLKHERNMAFIKNKDGHSALDMYQCHKCEAYSDKTRSAQKEELLLILKGRIPRDIMLKGRDTVLIFLKALKGGSEIFEKCCVSVVGQARAGKTSLIKRLTGQRFNSKEEETDGIVTTKTCKIDENRKKWKLETKQSDGKRQTAEGLSLKIYDFAGQELYYTTHQVFMMSRAVFMLVFNLTLDLNAKALIEIRADHQLKDFPKWMVKVATFIGCKGNVKVYELDMTNLDFINYWLSSIYAHTEENKQKDGIQVEQLSPPVFIVGTHENSLPGNKSQRNAKVKEIFGILRRILRRKPYEEHVVARFYAVDSSLRDDEEIQKLQSHILKVVQEQPYMNELVPAAWMEFERALEEKLQNNVHWIARKEVSEIATICKVTASELPALLQFQHDTGNCVHFVNTANVDDPLNHYIILNQMWLNCIFKGVITIKPEQQQLAVFRGSWERLAGQGLLDEKLARHVWREFEIDPNLLFGLMSRFDLLCEIQFSAEESARSLAERTRVFCVPCCLSETIEAPTVVEDDNCTVRFFVDFAGFLPNGLFFRLMVRAIRFSQARGGRNQCLSSCSAEFYVDQDHHLILRIFSKDRTFMEVIIVRVAGGRTNPSPAVCQMVFEFLMAALKDLCNIWSKGVKFTFGIPCDQCQDETDKLHLHTFDECRQALTVPCKGRRMNTEQFQRLFVKEHHHSTWPGFSLCLDKQRPPSSIGFAVDESIFRRVLLNISQNINEDINIWKVALKDHIMKANVVIHEATSVNQLFDALIDSAFLKAEDISILLETIKLTGVLRLQKCIPNCPRLDTVKITHFSKFRKSVMAFGMELTDDDIKLIVQCYDLHRRYNDKWSLVMDLEKYVILADDDKSMNAFKTSLDQLGLRRLSRRFEC